MSRSVGDLKRIVCGGCGAFLFKTVVEDGDAGCPKCQTWTDLTTARSAQPRERTRRRKPDDKTCEVCGEAGAKTRHLRGQEVNTCGRSCSMRWSLANRN